MMDIKFVLEIALGVMIGGIAVIHWRIVLVILATMFWLALAMLLLH
jgi:hypothetical protein